MAIKDKETRIGRKQEKESVITYIIQQQTVAVMTNVRFSLGIIRQTKD